MVWSQEFATRDEAKAAEQRIKGWSRKKKLALIRGDWGEISRLAKSKSSPSTSSGQAGVSVSLALLTQLGAEARAAAPRECCGILLGQGAEVTAIQPAANAHPQPETYFEIDPQALVDAHRAARNGGPQVIGYYHSHPNGEARPSATDQASASGDGRIWVIVAGDEITFWLDQEGGFCPLSYCVVPA